METNQAQLNTEIERHSLMQLLNAANDFYSIAENQQRFENWKKSKEDKNYANYINT